MNEEGLEEEDDEEAGAISKQKNVRGAKSGKTIDEQEAEMEQQMKDYFDQLDEDDQLAANNDEDPLAAGLEEDEEDINEDFDGEEEGIIRARPGAVYDKDEMDDAEYEKLLQQDMDEEELADYQAGKTKGKHEEEEEPEDDEELDDENENQVFAEMRKDQVKVIEEQEQKLMSDKPWQMKGEIRGHERPKDALLDNDVEFQRGVELKPRAQAKVSKDLEAMIVQRILKEAFDDPKDVVLKQDLSWKTNFEELNFEKDKRGLSSLYEEEYKANILGLPVESKELKTQTEIMSLWREINNCLDNLTNGSYIPMPLINEKMKKKNDIETINLEEKIPITVTTTDTVQPKQLFDTNHKNFLADVEKTSKDNQRSHKIAKRKIRNHIKDKRQKELVKTLEYKGQTKYEYNMVNKAKKAVDHEHTNASQPRANLTKSSDFFKVLQSSKQGQATQAQKNGSAQRQSGTADSLKRLKL